MNGNSAPYGAQFPTLNKALKMDKLIDCSIAFLLVIAGLLCIALIIGGIVLVNHFGAGALIVAAIPLLVGFAGLSEVYSEFVRK